MFQKFFESFENTDKVKEDLPRKEPQTDGALPRMTFYKEQGLVVALLFQMFHELWRFREG